MEPNWWLESWKKCGDFKGRSRRKEYWIFHIEVYFVFLIIYFFGGMISSIGDRSDNSILLILGIGGVIIGGILYIAVLIPSWALSIRRLDDTGKSGWWLLIGFIPYIGSLIILIFSLLDSSPGDNQYGPNPKGIKSILNSPASIQNNLNLQNITIADELEKLLNLKNQGILTEEEYLERKSHLLKL